MNQIVKFVAGNKQYQLSIIDKDGRRWMTAQQLGEALGNKNVHALIYGLVDAGEMVDGKHYSRVTLENTSRPGNPNKMVLSYRGVVRVAMRSQGTRAKEFRDWAEDVLAQVMANGTYGNPSDAFDSGRRKGIADGLGLAGVMSGMGLSAADIGKLIHLRRSGLTQREVGALFGCSKDKIRAIEKQLKTAGAIFPVINAQARDKAFRENVGGLLVGPQAVAGQKQLDMFGTVDKIDGGAQ